MDPALIRTLAVSEIVLVGLMAIAGLLIVVKSGYAIYQRNLLFKVHPDHPALDNGTTRLAVRQGIFGLIIGLIVWGVGVLGLVVLLANAFVRSSLTGAP